MLPNAKQYLEKYNYQQEGIEQLVIVKIYPTGMTNPLFPMSTRVFFR